MSQTSRKKAAYLFPAVHKSEDGTKYVSCPVCKKLHRDSGVGGHITGLCRAGDVEHCRWILANKAKMYRATKRDRREALQSMDFNPALAAQSALEGSDNNLIN